MWGHGRDLEITRVILMSCFGNTGSDCFCKMADFGEDLFNVFEEHADSDSIGEGTRNNLHSDIPESSFDDEV